jgi:hypothetical protein
LPRALPPPFEKGSSKTPWLPWPSTTKYLTLSDGWTIIGTQSPSQQVNVPKGILLTMKPGY